MDKVVVVATRLYGSEIYVKNENASHIQIAEMLRCFLKVSKDAITQTDKFNALSPFHLLRSYTYWATGKIKSANMKRGLVTFLSIMYTFGQFNFESPFLFG
jgi:hypothetical protein